VRVHNGIRGSVAAGVAVCAILLAQSVSAARRPHPDPCPVLLAQVDDEGDIDESYDSYGQDIDEEMEYDDAIMTPADTSKKEAMPTWPYAHVEKLMKGIKWYGHASFLIENRKRIYIDPFDLPEKVAPADLILITHEHSDHFSPGDIAKILTEKTIVVSIDAVGERLTKSAKHFTLVAPGDTVKVGDITIEAVPAYNLKKKYHPEKKRYVGFVVNYEGRTVYHAGDTDLIPEMKHIKADVALLPAGGKYTMDATEAAEAANLIAPKVAVPMHWGKIIGDEEDAKVFEAKCKVPVVIMKEEKIQVSPEK
jgi:L-ascorbate metabolism protein UlaG (beta-lactamase superfamily)